MLQRITPAILLLTAALTAPLTAHAQGPDGGQLQVHGFATQSFLVSNQNNYIGMNTSAGSFDWTEASTNLTWQPIPELRLGGQLHLTRLGNFGSNIPTIDWALVDYTLERHIGLRGGKVKIRWGLYNDTQDNDTAFLWCLLPEPIDGIDIRATNLALWGFEVYGHIPLSERLGTLDYSAYDGEYVFSTTDGYATGFVQQGLNFTHPARGITPGFDLRWSTPAPGLRLGASLMMYNAHGNLTNGTYLQPLAFWPTYYAQYNHRRLFTAWQYVKLVQYQTVTFTGLAPTTTGTDTRSWFALAGYRLTSRLQVGAYYAHYRLASPFTPADPANYFHDTTLSARYDLTPHLYTKLEGHIIGGNGVGFYTQDNPNGLTARTNLVAAKFGVSF